MEQFTSRQLYMMNGGNTLYIYKDGFGDVYQATPSEEEVWKEEIIASTLKRIDTETEFTCLRAAIDTLIFHNYKGLARLLVEKMQHTSPVRIIVFATGLWLLKQYNCSFSIIYHQFLHHRNDCFRDVFQAMIEFQDSMAARNFMIECLEGGDALLHEKACITITMWAYTGMPELRAPHLLESLRDRNAPSFSVAVQKLQQIFLC
ncbi:hypothetical protein LZZ85_13735 [Terrimonas sp. NA20]|uniref:HEAT repeat domain-containing protein n=1 Tax=Terrimonas ginsenosidimutans TaxID=2908004 RepID=A0ABS9KSR7_9BACT|nr:hypothetical protein [Terrimonas ginsenosidimutans]MCG2615356.1 hypothetical protein [Terrimonas ginsenosidimutans]